MPDTTLTLPEGYRELFSIDLQKDRKTALLINLLALVIAAALVPVGLMFAPFSLCDAGDTGAMLRSGAVLGGTAVYLVLHELVHGVFMRRFSHAKPRYGFTGMYAYAGSDAYFNRRHYITVALAPIVVWGIVLAVVCALVSESWFWVFWIIQIMNLSGAAGDLYVTVRFSRLPPDILVRDSGVAMTVYGK